MSRKILTILCDGMADLPIEEINGKTPLEYLSPLNMNSIADESIIGMVSNVPEGMNPGSDTANLSVFGYDPKKYYTGRAPLEAISMGIELSPNDAAFRCNIVNSSSGKMDDFTAHHIDSQYASKLISLLNDNIDHPDIEIYPGVSYRHALIWRNFPYSEITSTTPPHDIQDLPVEGYLPSGKGSQELKRIMQISQEVFTSSEAISLSGRYSGNPSSAWIWGGGTKPKLEDYFEKYNLQGYTISAVDLIHGIGRAAGLEPIHVDGATGYIDTNYLGKAKSAIEGLKMKDFVFLHFESPDESGHEGNLDHKLKSIKDIDNIVISYILDEMKQFDDYTVVILPDHPTPISVKTHTSDLVPFMVYSNQRIIKPELYTNVDSYSESSANQTGLIIDNGFQLMDKILNRDFS